LDEIDFSIQYPGDWILDTTGLSGTSFVLFAELSSDEDKFGENINLLIQNLEGQNIDLHKFAKISGEQVKTLITNSKIIESKRLNIMVRNIIVSCIREIREPTV
jgi:hypothetical protein